MNSPDPCPRCHRLRAEALNLRLELVKANKGIRRLQKRRPVQDGNLLDLVFSFVLGCALSAIVVPAIIRFFQ